MSAGCRYEQCEGLCYWKRTLEHPMVVNWLVVGVEQEAAVCSYFGGKCTKLVRNSTLGIWVS